MGKALILAVGGLITAIFSRLAGDEVKSWIPWFTKRLLQIAIECLPEAQRERFSEEWASHISDVPGEIGKLVTATGCVWAALETASILTYDTPILERVSKRIVDFSAATVALLFTAPLFSLLALLIRLECGTEESNSGPRRSYWNKWEVFHAVPFQSRKDPIRRYSHKIDRNLRSWQVHGAE
jgi:hypothetical protein